MKYAIIGGAFDPPTKAHLEMAKIIMNTGSTPVFMPCGAKHTFGKTLVPAALRLRMLEIITQNIPEILVNNTDAIKGNGRTWDLVQLLKKENIFDDFSIVIGSDNANVIEKWHRGIELTNLIPFIVFRRKETELSLKGRWCLKHPHEIIDIPQEAGLLMDNVSSTAVRKAIAENNWNLVANMVPNAIIDILKNTWAYPRNRIP